MSDINTLKELLVDCLIQDLMDPDKRGPNLYQVVARVISDNKPSKDDATLIRSESLENLVPFKLKSPPHRHG